MTEESKPNGQAATSGHLTTGAQPQYVSQEPTPEDQMSQMGGPAKECMGRWSHRRIAVWDPPIGMPGARFTNRWKCSTCGVTGAEPKRWEQ